MIFVDWDVIKFGDSSPHLGNRQLRYLAAIDRRHTIPMALILDANAIRLMSNLEDAQRLTGIEARRKKAPLPPLASYSKRQRHFWKRGISKDRER